MVNSEATIALNFPLRNVVISEKVSHKVQHVKLIEILKNTVLGNKDIRPKFCRGVKLSATEFVIISPTLGTTRGQASLFFDYNIIQCLHRSVF